MTKPSIAKNYIYNLMYQILVMIIPLVTVPYLSRVLGAEAIGIYSFTLSISTYFILFGSLGVSMYGQREIAYLQNNKYERSRVFFEIFIMKFITLSISMFIFFKTFCSNGEYSYYYKILILEIIANCMDISWYFKGIEEFKKTVMRNTIVKLISIICIFVFVKSVEDLDKYFVIYVLSNLIGNLSLWMYLPKYIQKIKMRELKIFRHLKPTITLFIPQIAIQIYTVLDKTMIGIMVPEKSEVGYYEQAQKIVKLLLTIVTSIGTVMLPRIANIFALGDKEKLNKYLNKSFKFVMFLSLPLMFGIISVSSKFVPIFYGPGYEKVVYLINIISPIILAIGLSNVIGTQYLLTTKQQKKFTVSVTIGAIVNLVLNIICIRLWQSIGACIATVMAEITVTCVQILLVKNELNISEILKMTRNYIVAGIIMFIVSVGVGILIIDNLLSIVCQVSLSMLIYIAILLFMKDDMVLEVWNMVKKKLKNDNKNEQN